jgi:predicted glycoside hydrolase/deacetylase ChbG (UPF0249 family)
MLIINADDLGRNRETTANSMSCHREGRITSGSAMVFMADSRRAAELATAAGLETGLHLNLSLPFDGPGLSSGLLGQHLPLVKYYRRSKWAQVLYNPLLKKKLEYVFKAQYDEYIRLYGSEPAKIDGHHHMHLCMNMIVGRVMPQGCRVRRNFSFEPHEKDIFNRTYRRLIDACLTRRYSCADFFFSIEPVHDSRRLERIIRLGLISDVEIMTHPIRAEEHDYLMSAQYRELIAAVPQGTYSMLKPRGQIRDR